VANENGHFQHSDTSFWGVVAMLSGALAMLSLTFAAILPPAIVGGLHANRLPGGSLNQLQAQVKRLGDTQTQMLNQNRELRTRLALSERTREAVVRRVGALETTIPMLLEVVPPGAEIDPLITAAIDVPEGTRFEAEGGYVTVTRRPLFAAPGPGAQALPPPLAPSENSNGPQGETGGPQGTNETARNTLPANNPAGNVIRPGQMRYGIAIGEVLNNGNGKQVWQGLSARVGMLLIGLDPAVSDPQQNGKNRIIAGPVGDYGEAEILCAKITRVGIYCLPVQYGQGTLLAL